MIENNDFTGFDNNEVSDIDFFDVEEGTEGTEIETLENKKPDDLKEREEEELIEKEESLFDEAEKEEDEDEEEEEVIVKKDEDGNVIPPVVQEEGESISALSLMKSKGLIDYELEEGEVLTDSRAAEILEDSMESGLESRIEELFSDVPDTLKELNKFVLKGGDLNTFLDKVAIQNEQGITSDMDMTEETNQELVIRNGLKEEGYDEEYITAQIEFLQDSKRMETHAKTHFKKWETKKNAEQAEILQSQVDKTKVDKAARRELKGKVSTFLKDTESVSGFTVSANDRKFLPDYMSDKTIKLENGSQVTNMQKDLMRVLNSPTGSIQMAKLLKAASKEGELIFDEIKKDTETKVTKKVRENVRRNKKSVISQSGGGSAKSKRPLADYFN
jgi:hypothetical protein